MDEIGRMLTFLRLEKHPLADILRNLAVCRTISKQTKIVGLEAAQPHIFFLASGLLRGYLLDRTGGEITDCFAFRYGDCRMSYLPAGRSRVEEYVETLEDTLIISFELEKLMPYLLREPALLNIWMACMADIYAEQILHKRMLCHTTSMERYEWFLKEYPGLIDRVSHRHIASFLNMSPVSLSRLRRKTKT